MLVVIIVISVALILWKDHDWDEGLAPRQIVGGTMLFFAVIVVLILVGKLNQTDRVIPGKISFLEQNNAEIEQKLEATVSAYQEYEKGVYTSLKPDLGGDDITVALSLYPDELKADAVVVSLIETYLDNNNRIREYKLTQLNRPVYAFWFYFGH